MKANDIIKLLESYESLDANGNKYINHKHYNALAFEIERNFKLIKSNQ